MYIYLNFKSFFSSADKPLQVTVSGYVLDLHDINESNQEFTVSLYLRHEWKDPRLQFTESEAGTDKLVVRFGSLFKN